MSREKTPRPGDTWESFMQTHNERVIPDDEPDPPSNRRQRRAARKRGNCAICGIALLGTGRPMTRQRWRCDVQDACDRRRDALHTI